MSYIRKFCLLPLACVSGLVAVERAVAQLDCGVGTEVCLDETPAASAPLIETVTVLPLEAEVASPSPEAQQAEDTEVSTRTYSPEQKALADGITADLKERRLKRPAGRNALEKIQQLKILQPYHDYSVNGERYVAKIYLTLSRRALKSGNTELAERYLGDAVDLDSKATGRTKLQADIVKAKVAAGSDVTRDTDTTKAAEQADTESSPAAEPPAEPAVTAADTPAATAPAAAADEPGLPAVDNQQVVSATEPKSAKYDESSDAASTKLESADDVRFFAPMVVAIPAGKFVMGSESGADDEKPVREVSVSAFSMSKYEVTMEQYRVFAADTDRPAPQFAETDGKSPVTNVSWADAISYTEWLSEKTTKNYRLPTEAEWEYAARGGTVTPFSTGEELTNLANCVGCGTQWDDKRTAPVGSFPPNPFGLYDVHGNVWEWVQDCWTDSYFGRGSDAAAVDQPGCERRVLRGGSWYNEADYARSSYRGNEVFEYRDSGVGFRVVHDGL